jgi:hypothetical protein
MDVAKLVDDATLSIEANDFIQATSNAQKKWQQAMDQMFARQRLNIWAKRRNLAIVATTIGVTSLASLWSPSRSRIQKAIQRKDRKPHSKGVVE